MKLYFKFLEFILVPLNEVNTVFQASDTQIGHLIPEMNRLLQKFLAKFMTMAEIKPKVADLTKVDYTNVQKQLSNELLPVHTWLKKRRTFHQQPKLSSSCQQGTFT